MSFLSSPARAREARRALAPDLGRLVPLAALALLAAGCSSPPVRYILDSTTTLPVDDDDPPGIWHDRERRTPTRALPIPIRGSVHELYLVRAEPEEGEQKETLLTHTYSDSHGCSSMLGDVAEWREGDRFKLVVQRKGFKRLERLFPREEVRDGSLTVVLETPPGGPPADAIGATTRAPGTPIQKAGATPIAPAAGPPGGGQ